jgi:hypothetical protein
MKSSNNISTNGGSIIGAVIGSERSQASASNVSVSNQETRGDGATLEEILVVLGEVERLVNNSDLTATVRDTACSDVESARAALKNDPPDPKRAQTFFGMLGEALKKATASETVRAATALVEKGIGLLSRLVS